MCIEHDWKEFIKEFRSWEPLYDIFGLYNSRGRVGQINGITFEIRSKEAGHGTPHVHARYENKNISISLVDFHVLAGNLSDKQTRLAIDYVKENHEKLLTKWEEYHCYTVPVFNCF